MTPRKATLKKMPEKRKEATKSRFQIVKLEQRIAPTNPHQNGGGHCGHHSCTR